jgi:hypothetical protein
VTYLPCLFYWDAFELWMCTSLYWCFTLDWSMLTRGSSTIFIGCAAVILLALVNYMGLVDLKYMHEVRRQKWMFISIFSSITYQKIKKIYLLPLWLSQQLWLISQLQSDFMVIALCFFFYSCWWWCCFHHWVLCIMWFCFRFFTCRDTFVKEMSKESKNDRNDRGLLFAWLQNSENLWCAPRL